MGSNTPIKPTQYASPEDQLSAMADFVRASVHELRNALHTIELHTWLLERRADPHMAARSLAQLRNNVARADGILEHIGAVAQEVMPISRGTSGDDPA